MSETYNLIYSPEALNDLTGIYSYIAVELKSPDIVKGQTNHIRKEIRSLDFMPLRYPLVDWEPWKSIEMHQMPVDNFLVYYTVNADELMVTIIRILYSGRDIKGIVNAKTE